MSRMEAPLLFAASVGAGCLALAAVTAVPRAAAAIRWVPVPPPPLVAAAVLAFSLTRFAAAAATTPPPAVRLQERQPLPDAAPVSGTTPDPARPERHHTVEPGECLWRIAASWLQADLGREPSSAAVAAFWPRIYAENEGTIGGDPDLIYPGQVLGIPGA